MMEADSKGTGCAKVSAVIVTHNSLPHVRQCVAAVQASDDPEVELVLVDNASRDGSADFVRSMADGAKVCLNGRNLGWAGGANAGVRLAKGEIIFFLNPDVFVRPDCLSIAASTLEKEPDVGAVGCKCLYPDGRMVQHAGAELDSLGITRHIGLGQMDAGGFEERRECPYVTGAAMAVRRKDLLALGGIDEDFFPAYYEDADLCLRLRKRGLRIVYCPQAVVTHVESHVLGAHSYRFLKCYHAGRLKYVYKHSTRREFLRFIPREARWAARERPRDGKTLPALLTAYVHLAVFAARSRLRPRRSALV